MEARNLRAIFAASAWYRDHLKLSTKEKNPVDILLLTNGPFTSLDEALTSLGLSVMSGLSAELRQS